MFNSLFWMFKQEDFKKHFVYLFSTYSLFITLSVFTYIITGYIDNVILKIILYILAVVMFICPMLCYMGYFWNLTENIIGRQTDIASANIYDGRIKEISKIELPEINTGKFIWRGIASLVATILLLYPLAILLVLAAISSGMAFSLYNFDIVSMIMMYAGLYIFISLFIPALLWNYAKQDSIFAVWNLPKAIHIMGTYFWKYVWNTLLFLVFTFVNYCIAVALTTVLGLSDIQNIVNFNTFLIVKMVIFFFLQYTISIYWVFVNAYLLGTIAPPSEG